MRTLHVDMGRQWRGGQRQCLLLCTYLAGLGEGIALVCRRRSPLWEQAQEHGLKPIGLDPTVDFDPLAVWRLRRTLRAVRPDIAAAHEAHALTLLALALGFRRQPAAKAPALVYHRRVDLPVSKSLPARWKFDRVARFICVSGRIAEILGADGIGQDRIDVVRSGTRDISAVAGSLDGGTQDQRHASTLVRDQVRADLRIPAEAVVLGTVGGLIAHKGHAVLLDALALLAGTVSGPGGALVRSTGAVSVHLLVVGEGPLRARLEHQAVRLGLAPLVHFLGERGDVGRLFGAMDLFVHPSLTEGLGSSIVDAFAAGVPVVASRTGGIPEIVRDGETGVLVAAGDARALAEALGRAVKNHDLMREMARRARGLYEQELTQEVMARKTLAVYRRLAAR